METPEPTNYYERKKFEYEEKKRDPETGTFLAIIACHYAHIKKRWLQIGFWVSLILLGTPLAFVPFFRRIYQLCVHRKNIKKYNEHLKMKLGINEE